MLKIKTKAALTTALTNVAALAFDAGGKWKTDAEGKLVVDANGNPIYIKADSSEQSVEGGTIARLNAEAKTHREGKEAAETALAAFKGLEPETARKAIETVSKIDAKKLIDAGEVDKVRDQIKNEFATIIAEKDKALEGATGKINEMLVGGVFSGSEFIRDRVAMPRDFFEAAMRSNFKVEDGKVIAYDRAGNRLMSKKRAGEYADADEALELLVDTHPQKDTILKANGGGGSGNNGGGGNRGTGRVVKRSDFEAMSPADQAATAAAAGKGEATIAD